MSHLFDFMGEGGQSSLLSDNLLGDDWSLGNWGGGSLLDEGDDSLVDNVGLLLGDSDVLSDDVSDSSDENGDWEWSWGGVFDGVDSLGESVDNGHESWESSSESDDLKDNLWSLGYWGSSLSDDKSSDSLLDLGDLRLDNWDSLLDSLDEYDLWSGHNSLWSSGGNGSLDGVDELGYSGDLGLDDRDLSSDSFDLDGEHWSLGSWGLSSLDGEGLEFLGEDGDLSGEGGSLSGEFLDNSSDWSWDEWLGADSGDSSLD